MAAATVANAADGTRISWDGRPDSGWGDVAVVVRVWSGRREAGRLHGCILVVAATVVDAVTVSGVHHVLAEMAPLYSDTDRAVATAVSATVSTTPYRAGRMLLRYEPHAPVRTRHGAA